MKKYYSTENYNYGGIETFLMEGESILWQGKPKKSAYVINASVKMLPLAIIWGALDGGILSLFIPTFFNSEGAPPIGFTIFILGFFLIHLAPVWIWLSQVLTAGSRWKNTEYAITDKRIMIRNGLIGFEYKSIYYTDISDISMHVGIIDRIMRVGDIRIFVNGTDSGNFMYGYNNRKPVPAQILDIEDVGQAYSILQKAAIDIRADIHYPNALRPDNNPGYHTKYHP